ncbi:MAG: c-type cytochrome [Opitutaceae bacterium]|nr:c-type cytochrome [Opitutaceae bacterium]
MRTLAAEPTPALRREAARLAGFVPAAADCSAIAKQLAADPHPAVRAALGDALRRVPHAAAVVAAAAQLARTPLPAAEAWPRYEREFERYLARWAMETHPAATRALLAGTADDEARALAALALGDRPAALTLAALRPRLSRPLEVEEIRLLARHHAEPPIGAVLGEALSAPATRPATLRALLETRGAAPDGAFYTALTAAARAQLAVSVPADQALGAEVAGAFRLNALAPDLGQILATHGLEPRRPVVPAALRALADLQAGDPDLLARLAAQAPEAGVRDDALAALLAQPHPVIGARVVGLLARLAPAQRGRALHGLSGSPAGAEAIAAGLRSGAVAEGDLGLSTLERLRALRPEEERFGQLWQRLGGDNDGSEPWKLTPAEAAAEAAKFARFRTLANTRGNPERGKELFTALCLSCHAFAGQGGQIAPPLDGVGHTGVDAMLRNILTPSAAMEGAYRTFRVVLRDGAIIDGFLVEDTADAVVVRIPGSGERRIARRDVRSASHTRRSLMPDGLLEGLAPEQVSDLFAHLKSLR